MSKLSEVNKYIKQKMSDVKLEKDIATHLVSMVSNVYKQNMASNDGFCYVFNLPIAGVQKLFTMLDLKVEDVSAAFQESWEYPTGTRMYSEPYYHILLLLVYYGVKENNPLIAQKALMLTLIRIWKGRKTYYLPYCDPDIMRYVINNMMRSRNLLTKYQTPVVLLHDYFVPTLLQKYGPEMIKSEAKIKNIFMQSYSRIGQLFGYNSRINMETGKPEYQDGILPLYIKARESGMKSTVVSKSDESFDENLTNIREDIAKNTSNFIVMNDKFKYTDNFIHAINTRTKVSSKKIEQLLSNMHKSKYYDVIYDIIILILSRTNVNNKNDVASPDFISNVEKNVISSKNNPEINKLTELLNFFLTKLFKDDLGEGDIFNRYSNVQKAQLRNIIIYGIVHNLKEKNK